MFESMVLVKSVRQCQGHALMVCVCVCVFTQHQQNQVRHFERELIEQPSMACMHCGYICHRDRVL